MKIEITIPVLNEEKTLRENVIQANKYIYNNITKKYKIIIADNGSCDNTKKIGKELEQKYNEVEFLSVGKIGVGLALRTSWTRSSADIVGYMDLDLATDLKHLKEVYNLFNEDNIYIINGSRLLQESKVYNRTIVREITSRGFNLLVKRILKVNLSDGMCGFKFLKRDIANKLINTGINTDGWFFSTEILVKAIWSGIKVTEIPLFWDDKGDTRVNVAKSVFDYLKLVLKMKKEKKNFINKFGGKIL